MEPTAPRDEASNLQAFNFEGFAVRVIERDGEPWFVLADVCVVLELGSPHNVVRRLHEDDRDTIPVTDRLGRSKTVSIINESGLYDVILDSRKPQAKAFRRWVTSEVLPAIHKHGGYLTPEKVEEALLNPDTLIRLATDLKEERTKRQELEAHW